MVNRIMKARLFPADNNGQASTPDWALKPANEVGRQWKKNVQDIDGEVLCGMYHLRLSRIY
jgi:hypothetical protein